MTDELRAVLWHVVELRAEITRLRELLRTMVADEPDTLLGIYFADIEAALERKP